MWITVSDQIRENNRIEELINKSKSKELENQLRQKSFPKRKNYNNSKISDNKKPQNSNFDWQKTKVKITKKLSADREFDILYPKLVKELGESILNEHDFKQQFSISMYSKKMNSVFKSKIKEKREFITKFNGREEIYRQNDFKYNAVKIGPEMWQMKLEESLKYIQKDLKLIDFREK